MPPRAYILFEPLGWRVDLIRTTLSFLGAIFSWLTLAVLMGALVIGAVFWMFGRNLPSHEALAQYTPPTISRIYSGEGRIIDEFAKERRLFAPIEDIPDLVKQAFISAEDKNFYSHGGYDIRGIAAAVIEAVKTRGKRVRGASTIPQQVAKNMLLGGERKIERKIGEIIIAGRLINTIGREKVLEIYLNEIFLGQNSYGVASAAQTYFNKSLDQLKPEEVAYLAVLPKAPSDYHPVRQLDRAVGRRNFVLREMFENGYLTKDVYDVAREAPLLTVQNGDFDSFKKALPPRDYFTDEIRRQLTRDFGEGEFFSGGLSIRATIDPNLQIEAAKALREGLEKYDRAQGVWRGTGKTLPEDALVDEESWRAALADIRVARDVFLDAQWHPAVVLEMTDNGARVGIEDVDTAEAGNWVPTKDMTWARKRLETGKLGPKGKLVEVGDVVHVRAMVQDSDGSFIRWTLRQIPEIQGGFMAMDVHTGRVIAMQGGFSYQNSVFNRATQAKRQPGSNFKPFVYAAALDSGYTPATIVVDAPIEIETGTGVWRPMNASHKFYGPTPLRTGIEQSRNIMTIRLANEIGMEVVAAYGEKFGLYDYMNPFLANALGSQETTLMKVVTGYAMIANGGERIEPTLVDRVQDRYGATIYRRDQRVCNECKVASLEPGRAPEIISNRDRVIDAITAYQIRSMMQGVVQRGTAQGRINIGVPVAGKTGTTNDAKDVWFTGFTSNIVAGCYMGYDTPRPLGRGAFGGSMCAPVFNQFMQHATAKFGGGKFAVPPGGHFIKIDRYTGARLSDDASGPSVVAEYFRDGEDPIFGIAFDGGFAMGANLPLFSEAEQATTVTTSDGNSVTLGGKASFGSLSSGGLY